MFSAKQTGNGLKLMRQKYRCRNTLPEAVAELFSAKQFVQDVYR